MGDLPLTVYRVGLGHDLACIRMQRHNPDRRAAYRAGWYRIRQMPQSARRRSWWGFWQAEPTDSTVDYWPRAVRGLTQHRCRNRAEREYSRVRRLVGTDG